MRKKIFILLGLILWVVLAGSGRVPGTEAAVYTPGGQALQVVHAVEETLLDKVIAATELGVRSTATGKTAQGWAVGKFSASSLSPLLTIGIAAGGVLWSPVIVPWLEENGWWFEDGKVWKEGAGGYYEVTPGAPGAGSMQVSGLTVRLFPDLSSATSAYNACASKGYSCSDWPGDWSPTYWSRTTQCASNWQGCCSPGPYCVFVYPLNGHTEYVTLISPAEEVGSSTFESEFENDFGTDGSLARQVGVALVNYLGSLVKLANDNWPGVVPDEEGYSPLSSSQADTVQQAMNDAVDPYAKEELQDLVDENGTSAPPGSNVTSNKDWEYTPEQMADAQKTADLAREATWVTDWESDKPDDGSDNVTAGSYTLPERKDLPTILTSFKSSIDALPIISWASGVELQVSGASSIINLPLPAAWGSSITVDFADYEDILDMMGAGLYALVGIASILFLFRGRGD